MYLPKACLVYFTLKSKEKEADKIEFKHLSLTLKVMLLYCNILMLLNPIYQTLIEDFIRKQLSILAK